MEEIDVYKKEWNGKYKGIYFSICFWKSDYMEKPENEYVYPNKGIWNSYISISKESIPKEFDKLVPKLKKCFKRLMWDYHTLEGIFDFSGGITAFDMLHNEKGEQIGFKIGNDYNHIWNGGEYLEGILEDVKKSIDQFIWNFPRYKIRSIMDGKFIMPNNMEKHNKLRREKMNKKKS